MDNLDLHKKTMQNKREAYATLLKVASVLETCTTELDWRSALLDLDATTSDGTWLTWLTDGMLVRLHSDTMCLMTNKGGGDSAVARYLLDYCNYTRLCTAIEQMRAKGELSNITPAKDEEHDTRGE